MNALCSEFTVGGCTAAAKAAVLFPAEGRQTERIGEASP